MSCRIASTLGLNDTYLRRIEFDAIIEDLGAETGSPLGQWYLYTFNRDGIPLRPQSFQGVFGVKAHKIYTSTPGISVPGVFV